MYKYLHILTIQRMSPYFLDEPLCFDSYLNLSIAVVFRTDRTRSLGFILNLTSL